ncbi:MAG TPA: hypothetical protein VH415_09130 [Nitrososphaeraceae archaeon]|jgi:hypothetical protein
MELQLYLLGAASKYLMDEWRWCWLCSVSRTIPVITIILATIATINIITVATLSPSPLQLVKAQVDTGDIDNGAVTSPKIRDGEVRNPDIADGAVTSDKIRNDAVVMSSIADNSITSDNIVDGSILPEDLGTIANLAGGETGQVSQVLFNTCSIDFDAVAAQKVATAFCPVPGAKIGDHVVVTSQDPAQDLITQSASINGTELVRIAVWNPNFKTVDPPNITWALIIFRS